MRNTLLMLSFFLFSASAWAQELILQGRVVDAETSEALPYVSFYIGEGKGTLSNADGEFKLKVEEGGTVVISCVGYDKQIIAANAMPETIRLKPYTTALKEMTINAISSKSRIENILKHTIDNLNKDYQTRCTQAKRYFFRTLTNMNGGTYITEAFMIAHSVVNLRSVIIISGLQGNTDGVGGTLDMAYTNIIQLIGVAPMTYEDFSWKPAIKPLSDISTLRNYYDIQIQQIHGGNGKVLYRIEFTWRKNLPTELKYRRNITGTAYVDAESYRLLRFDGSCNNYTVSTNIATLYSYATSIKFQLEYDYSQGAASVSHLVIHGDNEKSSYHVLLLAVDKKEKQINCTRSSSGNIVAAIRNAGYDAKLWEKYDIVKRTREEECAAFGRSGSLQKMSIEANVDTTQTDNAALRTLWQRLWLFSKRYAQEKVYIHMDNTCYCLGDTIWFAAYTRDTDDKMPSLQSCVLYVELLNNEGFLVERKNIEMVEGYGSGYFSLNGQGLYGGFYELRAYTRWQLNWGVHERNHSSSFSNLFANKEKEHAFFRDYDKLYSRVFPVYDHIPEKDDDNRYMTLRPLMEQRRKQEERKLNVQIYPEGGHLVTGIKTQLAFEATWDNGEWVEGSLYVGGDTIPTTNRGRGRFIITSDSDMPQSYTFIAKDGTKVTGTLPVAEKRGVAIHLEEKGEDWDIAVKLTDNMNPQHLGISVMNEGKISYFRQINKWTDCFRIPSSSLLPGVNQATVFDSQGLVLADRLFFVWKDKMEQPNLKIEGLRDIYHPYEKVELYISRLMADSTTHNYPHYISLSVRDDGRTDRTYDNVNILTEMLLASELRGFVPDANWYFQQNDSAHHDALDLLLMVQGWRRFSWTDMVSNTWKPVQPKEKSITLLGDIDNLPKKQKEEKENTDFKWILHTEVFPPYYYSPVSDHIFYNLEEDGHFSVSLPDFINKRIKSYVVFMDILKNISDYDIAEIKDRNPDEFKNKKSFLLPKNTMKKKQPKEEEGETSNLVVRLDKPFPRFVQSYNYYQQHLPDKNIKQKQKIQSDFSDESPSLMMNAGEFVYNLDDAGLTTNATFDISKAIAVLSLGNLNNNVTIRRGINRFRRKTQKIKRIPSDSIYAPKYLKSYPLSINFKDNELSEYEGEGSIENYVIYTDANLRDPASSQMEPLTIVEYPYPDGIKRSMPASRTFYMPGISQRVKFYHPNYKYMPENEKDYRRTLIWAPCLRLNTKGKTRIQFYNNSRTTHLSIEAEGQAKDGTLLWGNTE